MKPIKEAAMQVSLAAAKRIPEHRRGVGSAETRDSSTTTSLLPFLSSLLKGKKGLTHCCRFGIFFYKFVDERKSISICTGNRKGEASKRKAKRRRGEKGNKKNTRVQNRHSPKESHQCNKQSESSAHTHTHTQRERGQREQINLCGVTASS